MIKLNRIGAKFDSKANIFIFLTENVPGIYQFDPQHNWYNKFNHSPQLLLGEMATTVRHGELYHDALLLSPQHLL